MLPKERLPVFTQRLRLFLAATVAAIAAVVTVGSVTPASATPGTTCAAPSVAGDVVKAYDIYSNRYTYRVSSEGWTTASCPSTYVDYKYTLDFHLADHHGHASYDSTDSVDSTSLTGAYSRYDGSRIGSRIQFPHASYGQPYFGYSGVFVFVKSYAKQRFGGSWSTEPVDVQSYFLAGTGSFDTSSMAEQRPRNYCQGYGYSTGKC